MLVGNDCCKGIGPMLLLMYIGLSYAVQDAA